MKRILLFFQFMVIGVLGLCQTATPAKDILSAAYKKAGAENKNVILIFHASWCGWCHKMDSSMADKSVKPFFDENYVTVHLTVEESAKNKNLQNPGAEDLKKKFLGEKAGLPFWVVLNKEGKFLADSYIRKVGMANDTPGDNIGCPASDAEVAAFLVILKKTSKMNDDQLQIIEERFKKNKD